MVVLSSAVLTLIWDKNKYANTKRIEESKKYRTDITIYEFYFVFDDCTESRKKIKSENGQVRLLNEE
ncbi:hypothetical protein MTsDn5_23630 [Alteromonas gracilis]|uniref:hypothetical protein n=1 Tax=Alteromonas gracilis TaxID=1479524 RepID=UPI0036F2AAFC